MYRLGPGGLAPYLFLQKDRVAMFIRKNLILFIVCSFSKQFLLQMSDRSNFNLVLQNGNFRHSNGHGLQKFSLVQAPKPPFSSGFFSGFSSLSVQSVCG